jgi:hypothetical protein
MANNTSNSQKSSVDSPLVLLPHKRASRQPKPTPAYPSSLTGIVRQMRKDLKESYQFLIKDKNVKEIRITKIDRKKHIMYLWIYKKDRKYIARILSLLRFYPFKNMIFSENSGSGFILKCTVEINPTIIPKGIVVLN